MRVFPADCLHRIDFHSFEYDRIPQMFQHIAKYAPCWPRSEASLKATAPVKLPTRHGPETGKKQRNDQNLKSFVSLLFCGPSKNKIVLRVVFH